jgi:soluble P-type ATPase
MRKPESTDVPGIAVDLPGRPQHVLSDLILDFTGTLSLDGEILPGVAERLVALSSRCRITVMSADTFGQARGALASLPVEVRIIATGHDKAQRVREIGPERVVAIGNGRNDVDMVSEAALGIAIVGPEGASGELLRVADVVVRSIIDALDLLANPLRLKATLRD